VHTEVRELPAGTKSAGMRKSEITQLTQLRDIRADAAANR
jgi:hypothetical protein